MKTELTDGTILLRRFRPPDVDVLFEAARESVAEVALHLFWCHEEYSRADSALWVHSRAEAWREGLDYGLRGAGPAAHRDRGDAGK